MPMEQNNPEIATAAPAPNNESDSATVGVSHGQAPDTATGSAGTGDPTITDDEEYRRANFAPIRDAILGHLRYPILARRRGWSGQMEVAFTITPSGSVSELRVLTSSGFPVLDDQALAAVRRSSPFTPAPSIAATLIIPITFRLN